MHDAKDTRPFLHLPHKQKGLDSYIPNYCILDRNIKGTTKTIKMLANLLGKLQCAIRFITLLFPIESQWKSGPQCDIRNITTGRS